MDFIRFVNLSNLPTIQTQNYPTAILFGKALSKPYLKKVANKPDYVAQMILNKEVEQDEFHNTELFTDHVADQLTERISELGFQAYSQSEASIEKSGLYNKDEHRTPLPHKTLALKAGLGWIGKNNLLITPEYGCAISMCSVLTNAPLQTINHSPQEPRCGTCSNCQNICTTNAINGNNWNITFDRDEIINVYKCSPCLQCIVQCPWTKRYFNS